MLHHGCQGVEVEAAVIAELAQGDRQGLGGGLRGAAREGRQAAVDDVGAGLHGLEQRHLADAGRGVGVDLHRQAALGLDAAHKLIGGRRREVAGHVLDAQRVGAHARQLLGKAHEVGHGVDGARGVAERRLALPSRLVASLDGRLEVAHVVQGVEHAHDVDAVLDRLLHHGADHVVGVVLVAEEVLAAQQHLQAAVGRRLANGAQTLPGVLVQKAQAGVEGGAAPDLERMVAGTVQVCQHGQHVGERHARGDLALLAVAQDGLADADVTATHRHHPSWAGRDGTAQARPAR